MSETHEAGTTTLPAAQSAAPATAPSAAPSAAPGLTQSDLDRARAEGVEQGAQAERARIDSILAHASAGCSPLALQCIRTGLSTEQATAIMAAAAATASVTASAAPSTDSAFAAAMTALGNPAVSGHESTSEESEAALAASIVGLLGHTVQ